MDSQQVSGVPFQDSFLALPPFTPIVQAIETMADAQSSYVLVLDDQKLIGIFTEHDVVRISANKSLTEVLTLADSMTKNVITLTIPETEDIFALSRLFNIHRVRHLPVLDENDCVVGVVTPHSIRKLLKPEHLLRHIRAIDVMSERAICSSPEDPILAIAQKMEIHRVSCVVIVRRENSILPIGIITERDIVRFHQQKLDFARVPAQGVMSTPLATVLPQDSLWSIHQRMQQLNVRRLVCAHPSGKLAGIINQNQILKVLDPAEMYHVMQQMQEVIDLQTSELQELNQRLQDANTELAHLSMVDELTQIVNRRQLNQFLADKWQQLGSSSKSLSLIMCDVDFFKAYNDLYGHLNGDRCLVKIAQALQEVTRKGLDLVARYGGEEFAIVLPNTGGSGARCVSEKILNCIQDLEIPHDASNIADCVTVSLGTVTAIPTPANSPSTLLQVADRLLYESKQSGRNTYTAENLSASLPSA